jgi:hypothetical protein
MDDPESIILPDGIYDLTAIYVDQRVSKASGNAYYYVTWEVVSPPYEGSKVHQALLFSDKARWVWEKAVEHPLEFLLDPEVTAPISTDEYQGKQRNRVGQLIPRVG